MATITLVTATDPRILLEAAADGFLIRRQATPDAPFPSPDYLLALRQGGIRDDLVALAAERDIPGWFDPPLCVFNELPDWLGRTGRRPLGGFEQAILVTEILRTLDGAVFEAHHAGRFADSVARLLGELSAEDVTPDEFETACGRREGRDEFEVARDAELAAVYRRYTRKLSDASLRDGGDRWADCARAVAGDPDGLAKHLGGRREIRLFGLNDLRYGWRLLLRALAASPALDRVVIYTVEALDLGDIVEYATETLDEPETMATRLFSGADRGPGTFDVIEAPDADREAEQVALRIRRLADDGVPLHRIAVVSHDARPHLDLALRALERVGVPATARRKIGLSEVPVIRAILALVTAAAEGWTRHALVELADQPYFRNGLNPRVPNYLGYRARLMGLDAWTDALEALELESREYHERDDGDEKERDERRGKPPPRPERVQRTRKGFAEFAETVRGLDGTRTLREWLDWLKGFVGDDPLRIEHQIYRVPQERFDLARADLAAWRHVRRVVKEWIHAVDEWGGGDESLDTEAFRARLDETLSGDVHVWTSVHRGVRLLEGHAAMYRSFDHVFLVGMEAGRFPRRAPRSPIYTDAEREELVSVGLPLDPPSRWDSRERRLMQLLVAAATKRLTVSYGLRGVTGKEVIRSSFVEELNDVASAPEVTVDENVVTRGMPLASSPGIASHAARMAKMERDRESGALSAYNGGIEDPELVQHLAARFGDDHMWSPTRLETYAKCPWEFFASKVLNLKAEDDPDQDLDPRVRGIVLHDALHRFYQGLREQTGKPVFLMEDDLDRVRPKLKAALDTAMTVGETETKLWLGHPSLRSAKREELWRILDGFISGEAKHHEGMYKRWPKKGIVRTGVESHEVPIDEVVLERDGITFRFRGFIDRVEVSIDDRVDAGHLIAAVDYKTSTSSAPGGGSKGAWDDNVVLQVPLYAYALTQMMRGKEVARVEYWGLRQGKSALTLELQTVNREGDALVSDESAHERMERTLDAVVEHVRRIRTGRFPADPPPSCGCPPWCAAIDVCRIAGGPRVERRGRRT